MGTITTTDPGATGAGPDPRAGRPMLFNKSDETLLVASMMRPAAPEPEETAYDQKSLHHLRHFQCRHSRNGHRRRHRRRRLTGSRMMNRATELFLFAAAAMPLLAVLNILI